MKTTQESQNLWEKIYCYARNRGQGHHDAEDFAQDLFLKLFSNGVIDRFVATAESSDHAAALIFATAKRLLIDQQRRKAAIKRGGRVLEQVEHEEETCDPNDSHHPRKTLELKETLSAIAETETRLKAEYRQAGNERAFTMLRGCLFSGSAGIDSPAAASKLGISPGTLRVKISRMRSRFRELVSLELAA